MAAADWLPASSVRTWPARNVALRYAALAGGTVLLAGVHIHRPATVCPLRALTGVPCPFCGGTTAAVDLGSGRPVAALGASPIAVLLLAVLPVSRMLAMPRRWAHAAVWQRRAAVAAVLITSELWQLARFHLLS